jgi:hypothetical protein
MTSSEPIDEIVTGGPTRTASDVLAYALIFGLCLLGGGLLVAIKLVF